jgi:glycosyltransferase involved in cell wall biosynthesis
MLDPWFKHTYPLKHLKKWLYWPWAEYRVLRDAQAVFFTCEEERILARQSFWLYQCREIVVGLGITAPSGNPDFQRENFLQANPVLREKRILLFLSRIHEKKGCDLLIKAFSRVSTSDPLLHLVMAGPDQTGWKHQLVEQSNRLGIGNRISWPGMLSGDMKWGAYYAAEAFVLPSHQENFGIVVAEALACGVPVLISNKVNIWREIQADGAGLVDHDSVDGATRLLQNWLALPDIEKQRMRQAAARCFAHNYEAHMAASHLLKALLQSVAESTTRRDNQIGL